MGNLGYNGPQMKQGGVKKLEFELLSMDEPAPRRVMEKNWTRMSPGRLAYRRFEPGEALVAGLESFARSEGIRNAVITSCIGSVSRLWLRNLCQDGDDGPLGFRQEVVDEVLEIVSAEGHIVPLADGGTRTHVHIVATRPSGETIGGHCEEATVCTSAYLFLQVLEEGESPDDTEETP